MLWKALSPGEGNGNPLQYSCLENPVARGAWRAAVRGSQRVEHDYGWALSYLFHSGNQEHPGDILLNTTVEVLPLKSEGLEISKETKDKRLEDGYFRIGKSVNGVAEGMVDPNLNPISAFRFSVIQNSAVWAILNEIHIKKVTNWPSPKKQHIFFPVNLFIKDSWARTFFGNLNSTSHEIYCR